MNSNNQNKIMDKTRATGRVGVAVAATGNLARKIEASDREDVDLGRASGRRATDRTLAHRDRSKAIGRATDRRARAATRVMDRKARALTSARALTRDADPSRDVVSALGRASEAGAVIRASDMVSGAGVGADALNSPKKTRLPFWRKPRVSSNRG